MLFDLDGVLVDSYEVWFRLVNRTARHFGVAEVPRELFRDCWGQGIQQDLVRFYPGRAIGEVEAFYDAHFMDHAEHLCVEPDAGAVLARLQQRGIATALITNTPAGLAREILTHARLEIAVVVGGTDVARPKPAPDMVLRACELLSAAAAEALVVGDTDNDEAAARAAGVRFAGLGIRGDDTLERLAQLLDLV